MVYAVSLSIGGMALASLRCIEPKTLVELRFALDDGEEQVSVQARTVHLREVRRPGADYEIGVSFLDLPERLFKEIGSTVSRLLAAWDAVRSMELDRSEEMAG